MPAVNSRRLMAGDVLQAAMVSTATEKNSSMRSVVEGLKTVSPVVEDVLVDVRKVNEQVTYKPFWVFVLHNVLMHNAAQQLVSGCHEWCCVVCRCLTDEHSIHTVGTECEY